MSLFSGFVRHYEKVLPRCEGPGKTEGERNIAQIVILTAMQYLLVYTRFDSNFLFFSRVPATTALKLLYSMLGGTAEGASVVVANIYLLFSVGPPNS